MRLRCYYRILLSNNNIPHEFEKKLQMSCVICSEYEFKLQNSELFIASVLYSYMTLFHISAHC